MRGLYIHIPFCKSICTYCDFPKMVSKEENRIKYMDALFKELDSKHEDLHEIDTVYIGGGTPNSLPDFMLESLFQKISAYLLKSKESTIECNPELVTSSQASLFKKYGINRISLGVQSINLDRLRMLGRHHDERKVLDSVKILRDAGISNISMDFIFGTPGESMEELKKDISFAVGLNIPHLSFYSLIMEDKTILMHKLDNGEIKLPDDDLVADMYDEINKELRTTGYKHYEVSNYAKAGYESIHNELYWKCEEYIGIGLGACGYVKPYRYANKHTLFGYFDNVLESKEEITFLDEKKEFLMLGLRMLDGINMDEYERRFHSNCISDFNLKHHLDTGMLETKGSRLYIPESHMFIANLVFEEFV